MTKKRTNRRPQTPKSIRGENNPMAMAMQELRRSSATDRKSIADYRRRIKHDESGWE